MKSVQLISNKISMGEKFYLWGTFEDNIFLGETISLWRERDDNDNPIIVGTARIISVPYFPNYEYEAEVLYLVENK